MRCYHILYGGPSTSLFQASLTLSQLQSLFHRLLLMCPHSDQLLDSPTLVSLNIPQWKTHPKHLNFLFHSTMAPTLMNGYSNVNNFLVFIQPPIYHLCIASFHMDGEASCWFTWHNFDTPFINWMDFQFYLCFRFDENLNRDHHTIFTQIQ